MFTLSVIPCELPNDSHYSINNANNVVNHQHSVEYWILEYILKCTRLEPGYSLATQKWSAEPLFMRFSEPVEFKRRECFPTKQRFFPITLFEKRF